ncbi:MAG: hypothetical protein E6J91_08200 [Deltaproteobacteria bacterium]|nr:MAG: hypothetical protein E6J91_08200 [Deltaproteobacteria bacterium]
MTLAFAGRPSGPRLGVATLGLAAIYGLAALASFAGTDPEDVAPSLNLRLAAVALGGAVVGITSAVSWLAPRRRLDIDLSE